MRRLAPLLAVSGLAFLALAGCALGPDYKGPPAVAADAAARGRFVRAADPSLSSAPGVARWWEALGDPALTALVDDALAHSPDIDAAVDRIREARAGLRQKKAAELPSANASATYLHAELPGVGLTGSTSAATSSSGSAGASGANSSSSSDLDFYNLGLTASWEPDVFGGGRRGVEQARADLGKGYASLADAQVSLAAQTAQAYVTLRGVQQQIRLNAEASALQRQALVLMRQRLAGGTVAAQDVEKLQTQLESTDAQNVPLVAQADEAMNQLAILTGRTPGALDQALSAAAPTPLPPAAVAIGDPAALIAHRPDVREAERTLASSTAAIGVSKAKLFPKVQIIGLLGLGGTEPKDMFDLSQLTALAAPTLNWSILDFGKNLAGLRQSKAQRDEAEAQYRKAVLGALEDAETSLSRFGAYRRQLAGLAVAEAAATRAAALDQQQLQAGTLSRVDALDAERQQLMASLEVEKGKAQLTNSYIAVQKSLGLGWTAPPRRKGEEL